MCNESRGGARERGQTQSPVPVELYHGGKSKVAQAIWERLGDVPVFVEPFAGSLAVLLARPHSPRIETVSDLDGFIANVWRAIKCDPDAVAYWADDIVSEVDLHARHAYLVRLRADLTERLMADPDYYDTKAAGYWVWGASCWIGSGWCSGRGPWQVVEGKMVKVSGGEGIERGRPHLGDGARGVGTASGAGVERKRPHLMTEGKGVVAKVRHLGDAGRGINKQVPQMGHLGKGIHSDSGIAIQVPQMGDFGRGVNAPEVVGVNLQIPNLRGDSGAAGSGIHASGIWRKLPLLRDVGPRRQHGGIYQWMAALSDRLRRVRICCGDWQRIMGPAGTTHIGITGVLLDPPYSHEGRDTELYTHDDAAIWEQARAWAAEHGNDRMLRIALCGYADQPEAVMPAGWTWHTWISRGGYGNQGEGQGKANRGREVVFFSPHCLRPQATLFDAIEEAL